MLRFLNFATHLTRPQKRIIFIVVDVLSVPLAMTIAVLLNNAAVSFPEITSITLILMLSAALISNALGLPNIKLKAYEIQGIVLTAKLAAALGGIAIVVNALFRAVDGYSVFVVFTMISMLIAVIMRMTLREVLIRVYNQGSTRVRILVYGAEETGQQLAMALQADKSVQIVAFIDDNPTLQSLVIAGLRVYSPVKLREIVNTERIDRIVLTRRFTSQSEQARLAQKLRQLGCEVHSLPSFATLLGKGVIGEKASPVAINDLLGRSNLSDKLPTVAESYSGRRILITGAGGSIGSELCRQLMGCAPEAIVLLDHSEYALYNIDKELRDLKLGIELISLLGSVLDKELVDEVLSNHKIDVVLHAAAYKHLPLVEENVFAGLSNNVLGTKIVADAAGQANVERFILISTDKAVRPVNVMGASKRLAELITQDLATRSETTRYSMVRFGNVLGSSGSVIPLFEEQIARGGPVTLTHRKITRYFMTISEAARLVLLAGSYSRGGDLFVLDMGEPVPIAKLARQMIEASGFTVKNVDNPDGDIEIEVTGLRPGEKLHEELLISSDMLTTPHPKILRTQEGGLSEIEIANALKDLRTAIENRDEMAARAAVTQWIARDTARNDDVEDDVTPLIS